MSAHTLEKGSAMKPTTFVALLGILSLIASAVVQGATDGQSGFFFLIAGFILLVAAFLVKWPVSKGAAEAELSRKASRQARRDEWVRGLARRLAR